MSKDIPSWERTAPLTNAEALTHARNWVSNSTRCCYGRRDWSAESCSLHTAAWITAEAAWKMDEANQWLGWSARMGDLIRGLSGVRAGRFLADAGLRNEDGKPTEAALAGDEPLAAWALHHGYHHPIWHVARVRDMYAVSAGRMDAA
jgi:hypothetical protein